MLGLRPEHNIFNLLLALLIFGTKPFANFLRSFRKVGDEFNSALKDAKKSRTSGDTKKSG